MIFMVFFMSFSVKNNKFVFHKIASNFYPNGLLVGVWKHVRHDVESIIIIISFYLNVKIRVENAKSNSLLIV